MLRETEKQRESKLNGCIAKVLAGMKPPEDLTVSQWADRNRLLTYESSSEVGKWRTSRTPYMMDILDSFTDPKVQHIVVVAASQVGKSEAINNMIGYCIDQDPGPILFVQPTVTDAKEYSQMRIAPMIRETACLRRKVSDPKSRDSGNTILQKSFQGGVLTLTGSTEAHALASKPIRYLFGDERDRWALSAGSEGDPWELATARQITFYNSKAVEVSTPTIKNASAIEKSFKKGTMERWNTQCPHCGEYSEIIFDNIRWDCEKTEVNDDNDKVFNITSIRYICPKCGCISSEYEMKSQHSKWIATCPEAYENHRTRSFWLTAWTSPWATWESIILKYLQALGDTKKMQVVKNTQFGELWEYRGELESEDSVMARREEYRAELPDGVLALTCGVDTQNDRLEYEIVGHGHFGETWGIKKGIIMGRPDSDEVWNALDDAIEHVYRFESGIGLRVSLTFVDEGGHYTQEVRQHCRERFAKRVFAIKGRGTDDVPYTSPPKKQKIVVNGRALGMCWVYEIGVNAGKQLIMDNMRVKTAGAKYCHFPKRDDYGKDYFKGLLSERIVYKKELKHPWQWEKIPGHERNEALDCRNYAMAAIKALSPDFDALERRLKGTATVRTTASASQAVQTRQPKPRRRAQDKFYNEW